jgi:SDR family mycofactocin-dependent oxidoreductase
MGKMDGMVAFITGAARGQGRSHAVRLAEEGADIIALDLCQQFETVAYPLSTPDDMADTVKLVEDLDRRIVARQADVRDRSGLQRVLDEGLDAFGHVDIVLANAGIMPVMGDVSRSDQAWRDAIDVMLTGVFLTLEVTIPPMVERGEGGSIVITSSTAGLKGLCRTRSLATAGMLGYHAAKHGVVGLMRAYANALASDRIRVNTVHPTGVNTPMVVNEAFGRYAAEYPELASALQNPLPVELVESVDVSNAIVWLCSDEGRYITGVTLPVDAGMTNG